MTTLFSNRRHERREEIGLIEFAVEPSGQESFDGVIANISESGICLFTTCPLREEDMITFKKMAHVHSETAIVRWCDKSNKHYCKAGLEFV